MTGSFKGANRLGDFLGNLRKVEFSNFRLFFGLKMGVFMMALLTIGLVFNHEAIFATLGTLFIAGTAMLVIVGGLWGILGSIIPTPHSITKPKPKAEYIPVQPPHALSDFSTSPIVERSGKIALPNLFSAFMKISSSNAISGFLASVFFNRS